MVLAGCDDISSSSKTKVESEEKQRQSVTVFPLEVNLGNQPWGTHVEFQVDLMNNSSTALRIESITSTCYCTVVDKDAVGQFIEAKAPMRVTGALDTGFRSGPLLTSLSVYLSNDELLRIGVRAFVTSSFELNPATIDVGQVQCGLSEIDADCAEPLTQYVSFVSYGAHAVGRPVVRLVFLSERLMLADHSITARRLPGCF
ncbi:MAG: DUF1573 domain-containing protein [Phycisphaerales bacterium]|nr:DUF1573 domain-containing protein [Phycisphaerales bacterium]